VHFKGQINITKRRLSARSDESIRIFDDAQKYHCRVSHETRELLRGHLDLIDDEFRRSAAANQSFLSLQNRITEIENHNSDRREF
jgi:UTP:GlnB (protein PII) uridylyltransferase